MAEEFVVGMAEVAEGRCLLLNVATDAVPRVDQTSLLVVTVSLLAPQGVYGMPGPDDKLDLEAIEGELKTSLVDACELVVKITGDSFRRFMFFAPVEIHDLDAVIERLRSRHSGRTFELGSQSDADHAIFARMLEDARRGWEDIRTIQELERAGAELSQPRQIDFTLVLPSLNAATEASRDFETDPWRSRVGEPDDAGKWSLTITQVDVVAPDRIAHYSAIFQRVAKAFGGSFDGWGASVDAVGESGSS